MFATVVLARRTPAKLSYLTYRVPPSLAGSIALRQLVAAPFGKSQAYGIVFDLSQHAPILPKNQLIKDIAAIINLTPVLSEAQSDFIKDISDLYHTSFGWLIKNTLFPLQPRKIKQFASVANSGVVTAAKTPAPIHFFYHRTLPEAIPYLEKNLNDGAQNLLLVPEINQLKKISASLPTLLLREATIIDNQTSAKILYETWLRLWRGEALTVIGTRSSLFLPWTNLRNVVVLDESNPSYKSFEAAPRLETRDAARFLGWHHGATVHLLSQVPSLETYQFARQGLYPNNLFTEKVPAATPPPQIEIINLKDEYYRRNNTALSEAARKALSQVKRGEIGLCLVNKRGTASFITCQDCGFVWQCKTCRQNLTWHEQSKSLRCHFCKTNEPLPGSCPTCQGTLIKLGGSGSEKIEQLLRQITRENNGTVVRIDSDSKHIVPTVDAPLYLAATAAAWTSLPWEKITTVVFVDPDTMLQIPEYRISERLWYYIQMARLNIPATGRCFVQTRHPEQPFFQHLNNRAQWYAEELKSRRRFKYPPYWSLLKLSLSRPLQGTIAGETERLYRQLRTLTSGSENVIVLPPIASVTSGNRPSASQIIIIKIKPEVYKKTIKKLLASVPNFWKTDLNPHDLLNSL